MTESQKKPQIKEKSESIKIYLSDRAKLWELNKKTGKSLKQLMREAVNLLVEKEVNFDQPAEPVIQFVNPPPNFNAQIKIEISNSGGVEIRSTQI